MPNGLPVSAVKAVVEQLRDRIVAGELRPGTRLPAERDLAAHLQVSRPTLRQSLAILGQMGLVTAQRGRNGGIVVTNPSAATVGASVALLFKTNVVTAAQLTEVRRGLEVEAAQLAAARRSPADLRQLVEALERYVGSEADPPLHNRRGRQFHYAIAEASHNPLLVQMMYSLNQAFAECLDLLSTVAEPQSAADAIHRPIAEAIARQDVDGARQAMVRHFDQLERLLAEHGFAGRELGLPPAPPTTGGPAPPRRRPHPAAGRSSPAV